LRPYDILIMYPATLTPDEVDQITKRIFGAASSHGLEVEAIERWPKRRFAYEVKHHTEGYYCDVAFEATPEGLAELERLCRLEDSVLRYKVTSRAAGPKRERAESVSPPASTDTPAATN
jgi:small subunit ribosomal protein S6